ncbi:MAG: hypothetical protein ACK5MB_07350 [Phycisphaerales bacterium]|jgi:hypothetical protein
MTAVRNPYGAGDNGPSPKYRAVVASDTVDFADGPCRALMVGTAGTATVIDIDDQPRTIHLVQGLNPIICQRVNATGLTAANITAYY